MNLVGDRRGQSIQIGAVLLFGVLIIAFASYQAAVVPDQNRGVEYNHNQGVQSDMQDLRNAIVSVPGSTSPQAVSIELSTQYPSRLVARNPGPPSGSLRTSGTTEMRYNITVRNAAAGGETGDVWNGTARPYNTGTIAYSPNYNVYTNPPTTYYGQSVAYNQFRTANLTLTEQSLVNGRDITLVALNGSLSRNSDGSTSVDVRPVSRSDDPIVVTNHTDSSQVSVSVPTRLPQSAWEELLADEIDDSPGDLSNDRYVADVTTTDVPGPYYNLTITFEQGADYRLRMAKAGVGNGVASEEAAYLTNVSGDGSSVAKGSNTELVLEVRDEYNNPVQGVTVFGGVNTTSDGSLTETEAVSDSGGQVRFEYNATGVTPDTQGLNFSYRGLDGGFDGGTPENVTMDVRVTSGGGGNNGGGGGGGNGFNSTTASNLPSDETGLNQTVSFSPQNEAILNGEYVSVNFNDAQASTVDYANNGEVVPPSGFEVENVAADTDANRFTVNLTATRDILPSENVSFNVTGISTEGQAGPLDVGFVRGDTGGSQTATFNVGGGGVPFSGVSATDVSKKQGPKSGPFTQTVSFTLGRKLTSGTTVTIDLSDAQAGASNGKNVDYSSADVTESSSMGGDITLSGAEIEYENTAAIASGTEIIIDISNVQTDSGEYGPFDVLFTRSDTTGSNSDSFEIK